MFNDVIKLISITSTVDAIGDTVQVKTEREVFANKKSIKQSEFYQALSVGFKPELTFELFEFEYEGEAKLSYESKEYSIIRTFVKTEFIELICEATK